MIKKNLFTLIIGFTFFTSYSQESIVEKRTNRDVSDFSELVKGDIPALALNNDQLANIIDVFTRKNEKAIAIDPHKVGKMNSVKQYQALQLDAYKEAMEVLTLEQKLAYKKNKEIKEAGK